MQAIATRRLNATQNRAASCNAALCCRPLPAGTSGRREDGEVAARGGDEGFCHEELRFEMFVFDSQCVKADARSLLGESQANQIGVGMRHGSIYSLGLSTNAMARFPA